MCGCGVEVSAARKSIILFRPVLGIEPWLFSVVSCQREMIIMIAYEQQELGDKKKLGPTRAEPCCDDYLTPVWHQHHNSAQKLGEYYLQ